MGYASLNDPIDTTTSQSRLIINIFAYLAKFERDLIRERTHCMIKLCPRETARNTKESEATTTAAETLYREGKLFVMQISKKLAISKNTLYKYFDRNTQINSYKTRTYA